MTSQLPDDRYLIVAISCVSPLPRCISVVLTTPDLIFWLFLAYFLALLQANFLGEKNRCYKRLIFAGSTTT